MTLRRTTLCVFLALSGPVLAAGAKAYPDPAAAIDALIAAARTGKVDAVVGVLGDRSRSFLVSGDAVADRAALEKFVTLFDRSHTVAEPDGRTRTLAVGADEWPFPIPLVQVPGGWSFDAKAGEAELLARRVGQNELDAMQVCLGYVNAQRDYLARNPEGVSVPHYADRLMSSPGKRDGLYWKTSAGESESPMGPGVSGALREGYTPKQGKRAPYRGYLYRVLTAQGPNAEGGAMDYLEEGKLTRGFGLVAYPASYGKSGVMTFVVNQAGVLFEKDLGPKTSKTAEGLKRFDPDQSWKRAEP
jgi:hypothetical protein